MQRPGAAGRESGWARETGVQEVPSEDPRDPRTWQGWRGSGRRGVCTGLCSAMVWRRGWAQGRRSGWKQEPDGAPGIIQVSAGGDVDHRGVWVRG